MTHVSKPGSDELLAWALGVSVEDVEAAAPQAAALQRGRRTLPTVRQVSNRYPLRVTEAYGGDPARALADDDATVAETVRRWEEAHGLEVQDLVALGPQGRPRPRPVSRLPPGLLSRKGLCSRSSVCRTRRGLASRTMAG